MVSYLKFRRQLTYLIAVILCGSCQNAPPGEKKAADMIVYGGTVVTMNPGREIIENGCIVIHEGRIMALGREDSLREQYFASENHDARGGLIIPGLINAHTHIPMTLFRGLADDLALRTWLEEYIFPAEARFVTDSFVRAGTRLGLAEMIRGGVTTFCDMYYFEEAIAAVTAEAGMRAILARTVIDFPVPDASDPDKALEDTREFARRWKGHPLITPALGPHAPYTVSTETLRKVKALADELQIPVTMHVSETSAEVQGNQAQYGAPPVEYLDRHGLLDKNWILAHMVHVSEKELDMIREKGCGIVHCPQSNMKLASGIAPLAAMLKRGIPTGLGTDGAASNNDLDLWEEMDAAAKIHKAVSGNPEVIPAWEAFEMATIGGARALHMEDKTGSLEAGKYADLVILSADGLHRIPQYEIYSGLVYTTKASDVQTVVIHGKTVMKDRKLLTLDEEKIKAEAAYFRDRIMRNQKEAR